MRRRKEILRIMSGGRGKVLSWMENKIIIKKKKTEKHRVKIGGLAFDVLR